MATKPMQLCWDCKKACAGCMWSLAGEPIPGWTARQTQDANGVKSFAITACPEFVRDSYRFGVSRTPLNKKRSANRKQSQIASAKKYRRYTGEAGTTDDTET